MTDVPADAALRELLAVAQEQLRWQQAATLGAVRDALTATLTSTEMRVVYEMCDGEHTFREMATAASVSVGTIGNWTKRWREAALVYETAAGRMKQLVSLEAIGLPLNGTGDVGQPTGRRR